MADPSGSLHAVTDEALVDRCRAELPYNTTAYAALVRRHEARVYETCRRYLNDEAEAEEATQDVFLRVFHRIDQFEGRATFRTWLFRIASNECATRYRRIKRRRASREAYAHRMRLDPDAAVVIPDPFADGAWSEALRRALEGLTSGDRRILILRHVSELPFDELSQILGLKLSATKMRLYRAEERLRRAYAVTRDAEV